MGYPSAAVTRVISVLLVFSILMFQSATAQSAPKRVQVLGLMTDEALVNAQSLTEALRHAVDQREGFALAPGEFSLEVLSVAMRCAEPPDQPCLEKIARKIGCDRFIWGILRKDQKQRVSVHLNYWEEGSNQRETTLTYSASLKDAEDDALRRIAADAVGRLLRPAEGTLRVRAGELDGELFVDDQPKGKLVDGRAELTLPAGEAKVRVVVPGYRDAVADAEITPGGSTEVKLEPVRLMEPEGAAPPERAPEQRSRGSSPIVAYSVLGLGAVATITGGVFWYLSSTGDNNRTYQDYRAQVPKGSDPCDAARADNRADILDICRKNQGNRVVAWVLMPTGLVLMGLGAYLLITAPPREGKSQARVTPLVGFGPGGGKLDVRLSF